MPNTYKFPPEPDNVFEQVTPSLLIEGQLVVFWKLKTTFNVPGDYLFELEYNEDLNDPESWQPTGVAVTNQYSLTWTAFRISGRIVRMGIRIKLTTQEPREYYSFPVPAQGTIPLRQWNMMRTIARRYNLHARNLSALPGYLFKRKWFGPRCSCRDEYTREITDTYCAQCYGTGIVGGYWKAWTGRLIDISPKMVMTRRDVHLIRGVTDPQVVTALILSPIPVDTEDVWIRSDNDIRYYVRASRNRSEFAGLPVVQLVELGPAEYTNIIYSMPIN